MSGRQVRASLGQGQPVLLIIADFVWEKSLDIGNFEGGIPFLAMAPGEAGQFIAIARKAKSLPQVLGTDER